MKSFRSVMAGLRGGAWLRLWPLLGAMGAAGAPPIDVEFATDGGDAWTFSKSVAGRFPPGGCDAVVVGSAAGSAVAALADGRFFAAVPLQPGRNAVTAECRRHGETAARSPVQHWRVRVADVPTAWIRTRVVGGTIELDGGRSERAPARPAPIVRYVWSERADNPAPLRAAATGRLLRDEAPGGERLEIAAPDRDGDYVVALQVTDRLGRSDVGRAMFRVRDGRVRAVDPAEEHPLWVDTAVLYGVAPHFFGDQELEGVTQRLDEIAALGATAVWLSPITEAPDDDFGYAVLDHFAVRDRFGSDAQLRALVERAHELGLKVLMDFVPNHVSARHAYHRSAERHGRRSPYYDWFERDADGRVTSYFDWDDLKNLDYDNPDVQAYVIEAFAHWIREYDVDGFRVDASWAVRQRAPEFWPRWRAALKRIEPDLLLLAEASARDDYYVNHGFDAAYDWTWNLGEWAWREVFDQRPPDLDALRAALINGGAGFAPDTLALRFLNNNDTGDRFITRHGPGLTRAAAALLFTVPGLPLIYNGDEVGAQFEPYDEGPELRWDDPHGLVPYYARLAALRRRVGALTGRRLELVDTSHDQTVLAFLRPAADPHDAVLVVINFGERRTLARLRAAESLATLLDGGRLQDVLTGDRPGIDTRRPVVELAPYQAVILRRSKR